MTVKVEGAEGAEAGAASASDTAFEDAFKDFAAPEGEAGAGAGAAAAAAVDDKGGAGDAGAGGDGAGGSGGSADGGGAGAAAAGGGAGAAAADAGAAGDDKGGAGAAAAADAGGGAGAAAAGEEPKPAADADAILEGLKKLIGEPKPAGDAGAGDGAGAGAAAGGGAGAAEEKPIYTTEEQAFLTDYAKDWGDVQKGEALIRRGEYRQLLTYVFGEVAKFVAPIKETAEVLATRTHLSDIETNIPDYSDKLRDEVSEWAKAQPAYLQAAYNQVITAGTVEEVKDLVERYRAATGQPAKPTGGSGAGTPKPKDNELSEPAKKAAAALAPVESKRSVVLQPDDPSNFDDAWKQAAADLG